MASHLRIGTRPSALALAQTNLVRARIEALVPGIAIEIVETRTSGDQFANASLAQVGGKGLFIKELEQALADRRIDIAIHSMKDLPARLPPGFRIAAVPEREDTRDALVTAGGIATLESLPQDARLGTSSSRRKFQALRKNHRLKVMPLRGNVDTRLRNVASGALDAIIVAMAGLKRLGRTDVKPAVLDARDFIPAGGQGALAIEALAGRHIGGSEEIDRAMAQLNNASVAYETAAERAFLATLGASCVTPVGVKGTIEGSSLALDAMLFSPDGAREMLESLGEPLDSDLAQSAAEAAGARLAEAMLACGADTMLSDA
ncbi:MAG TPA: hydroxymethylbilane synthase [Candidatus Binataceae bacterium]|nr:hydroxymethylbilane synthase [Candidatus Binataceae bacterium]